MNGKISSFQEGAWAVDPDHGLPPYQIEFLENLPGGKIQKYEKERNLDRIDRIITGDENLWKSYFHWYNYGLGKMINEMDFTVKRIEKARTTNKGYHLEITVPESRYGFRYSTQVDSKGRFSFPKYLLETSKINKDKDVTHFVFATPEVRYIIDYKKLKSVAPLPPMIQDDFDGVFHLTDLLSTGCVADILWLRFEEAKKFPTAYRTFESEIRIYQYKKRFLHLWKILPAGKKERPVVIVAFHKGRAVKNLAMFTRVVDGKTTHIPRPYRSIREALYPIQEVCKKRDKVAAYRTVAQHSKTFGLAFETFKASGKLPRILPLYGISDTEFVAVVSYKDVETEEYKRFEEAILGRLEQKAKQKPRKKKVLEYQV